MLELTCLNHFRARLNGSLLTRFESDNIRALLIFLACESEHPHSRARLAAMFWPDSPESEARNNLRQAIFKLQQTLKNRTANPPYLLVNHQTIQFNLTSPYEFDYLKLQKHLDTFNALAARQKQSETGIQHLVEAARLYAGPFLQTAAWRTSEIFEEWMIIQREKLHRKVFLGLDFLAGWYIEQQHWEQAQVYTMQQITLDPWYETGHRRMMEILASQGKRSLALHQFEKCKAVLQKELGVEPMPQTLALYEKIRRQTTPTAEKPISPKPTLQPASARLAPKTPRPGHNLPENLSHFIGREALINQVSQILKDRNTRLVALTGLGGIGKTRLAIELGRQLQQEFPDGVWFVPLDGLPTSSEAYHLEGAIASNLPLPQGSGTVGAQLKNFLHARRLLLICDNFEPISHLSPSLQTLLDQAPLIKCLVTTRDAAPFSNHTAIPVPPLTYPADEDAHDDLNRFEAARLFMQQARKTRADVEISRVDEPFISLICKLVGGLPLALELAASWTNTLSCREIAEEIQKGLRILKDTNGQFPARQGSISIVFEHMWQRLSFHEQRILAQLSVFRGGFTREAAETIAGATLETLRAFIQQALLKVEKQTHSQTRYAAHELVSQFSQEKYQQMLPAHPDLGDLLHRHADYYRHWLQKQRERIGTEKFMALVNWLEPEMDNLKAAWMWAVETQNASFLRQAAPTAGAFFSIKSRYQEGVLLFENAVQALQHAPPENKEVQAATYVLQNRWVMLQNSLFPVDYAAVTAIAQQALARAEAQGDALEAAYARLQGAISLRRAGKFSEAWQWLEQGLANLPDSPAPLSGDTPVYPGEFNWVKASLDGQLAMISPQTGKLKEGERYGVQSLRLFQAFGFHTGIWYAAYALAYLSQMQGNYTQAEMYLNIATDALGDLPLQYHRLNTLQLKGYTYLYMKDYPRALQAFQQALEYNHAVGDDDMASNLLGVMGYIASKQENWAEAVRLAGQAEALARKTGNRWRLAQILVTLALGYGYLNSPALCQAYLKESLELANDLNDPNLRVIALVAVLEWLVKIRQIERSRLVAGFLFATGLLRADQVSEIQQICNRYQAPIDLSANAQLPAPTWEDLFAELKGFLGREDGV